MYKLTRYRYVVAKWRVIKVAISFRTLRDRRARGKEISRPLFLRIPGDRSMKRSFSRYIVSNSGEKKRGGEGRSWLNFEGGRLSVISARISFVQFRSYRQLSFETSKSVTTF